MATIIKATDISLYDLENKFNLTETKDEQFFNEWLDNGVELSDREKESLERIKRNYFNLNRRLPLLEDLVKMVVLAPLLDLAEFFSRDLDIKTEAQVEFDLEDKEEKIRGYIDVLALQNNFWILVIETKRTQVNVVTAVPQILFYMLNSPNVNAPTFGFITSGIEFIFLKLIKRERPIYARTYALSMERPNELEQVLLGLQLIQKHYMIPSEII